MNSVDTVKDAKEYINQFADTIKYTLTCDSCGNLDIGKVDLSNNAFYCDVCWDAFIKQEFKGEGLKDPSKWVSTITQNERKSFIKDDEDDYDYTELTDELKVFGFMRNIENDHAFIIPLDVKQIIFFFFGFEHWYKAGKAIRIEGNFNNQCIRDRFGVYDFTTAFGAFIISSGCHWWKFRINRMYSCSCNMFIGIVDAKIKIEDQLYSNWQKTGYDKFGLIGGSGASFSNGLQSENYSSRLYDGDTVEMYVDFDQQMIGFLVNRIDCGPLKSFENFNKIQQHKSYRLAVSFYGGPNAIELLGYSAW